MALIQSAEWTPKQPTISPIISITSPSNRNNLYKKSEILSQYLNSKPTNTED